MSDVRSRDVTREGGVSRACKWDAPTQCAVWVYSGGCRPHKGLRAGLIAVAQYIGTKGMNGDQGACKAD